MAVSGIDSRTAAITQVLTRQFRLRETAAQSREAAVDSVSASPAPPSADVTRLATDRLDLQGPDVAIALPVLNFEDAAFSEYLNITAKLLKAGVAGFETTPQDLPGSPPSPFDVADSYDRSGRLTSPPTQPRFDVYA